MEINGIRIMNNLGNILYCNILDGFEKWNPMLATITLPVYVVFMAGDKIWRR